MGTELGSPRARRTRARLQEVAMELFARQGFERTTVAQIAEAAGVTQMTFFRHFGSKDTLVVEDPYDPVIVEGIAAQPLALPPLQRVIGGIRAAWSEEAANLVDARERLVIAANSPALQPALVANTQRTQDLIAEQLRSDGTDATAAAVVATAVLAGVGAALLAWAKAGAGDDLGTVIECALRALEGGSDV